MTRSKATVEAHIERIDANIEAARKKQMLAQRVIDGLQEERAKYEAEIATKGSAVSTARRRAAHTRRHVNTDKPVDTCDFCIEDELV